MRKELSAATVIGCLMASASLAAWPSAVAAQPDYAQLPSGPYVAGEVGYNFPDSVRIIPYSPKVRLNGGGGGIVFFDRLGYRINPHWRVELEASFRPNWVSHPSANRNVNAMGNVLYDFMPDSRWTPFVGAGIGANTLNVNARVGPQGGSFAAGRVTRFSWQGIGGVSFVMSPHLNLDVTYRYTENEGNPHLRCFGACPFAPRLGFNASNTVSVGLRYAFGAPAAPPPPPPEAAPPPPPPPPAEPAPPPPQPEAAPPPPPEPAPPPPEPPRRPRG